MSEGQAKLDDASLVRNAGRERYLEHIRKQTRARQELARNGLEALRRNNSSSSS